jgi:8-amino-7-oxononanoate synthase
MKNGLRREGFSVFGDAHVLALEIGDEAAAVRVAKRLLEENIFVLPARYPTVPLHRAILRIGMTALHEEEDINLFIDRLKEVYNEIG